MVKIAIMYDFDQTLCTKNMQEYSLLPKLNIEAQSFWKEVGEESIKHNMDSTLAYMYLLLKYAKKNGKYLTRQFFNEYGSDIEYYPGVEDYFDRINCYAASKGIMLEHFIISSGTKEIIDGCSIAKHFTKIYGCEFHYDENGNADWPSLAINYTGKTQFLFRINKNCLDVYDNTKINIACAERDIPFENMIYIADGFTDVPCMKIVKDSGGYSIAVHNGKQDTYTQLLKDNRVNYVALADYTEGSQLDNILHGIIDKICLDDKLNQYKK